MSTIGTRKSSLIGLGVAATILLVGGLALASDDGAGPPPPDDEPEPPPVPPPPNPEPPDPDDGLPGPQDARGWIELLAARWELGERWRDWLLATAYSQGGLKLRIGNGTTIPAAALALDPPVFVPEENSYSFRQQTTNAAKIAWDRNRSKYSECIDAGTPIELYTWGGVGMLGMLPANGLEVFTGTHWNCLSPLELFAAGPQILCAMGIAARIRTGGYGYNGTMGSMRLGWGNPSSAGADQSVEPYKGKIEKFNKWLGLVGSRFTAADTLPAVANDKDHFANLLDDWFALRGPIR